MRYEGTINEDAIPFVNIRATAGGEDIGDIKPGTPFTADGYVQLAGKKWLHLITPKVGYVREDYLTYHQIGDPPPVVPPGEEQEQQTYDVTLHDDVKDKDFSGTLTEDEVP